MKSDRQVSAKHKIQVTLAKINFQNFSSSERLQLLENTKADEDVKHFFDKELLQQLEKAHKKNIKLFQTELMDLSRFIITQLKDLENTSVGESAPISHVNASVFFDNLSKYIGVEIINAESLAKRTTILKRWIEVIRVSLKRKDFFMVAAINAGLSASTITQFKSSFVELTKTEKKLLNEVNEIFIKDQGWQAMMTCSKPDFIPNFVGIKKQLTRAKEARGTHAMHKEHLQTSGKLEVKEEGTKNNEDTTKNTSLNKIDTCLTLLRTKNKINTFQSLTALQKALTPTSDYIKVDSIKFDEQTNFERAQELESECLPKQLIILNERLRQTIFNLSLKIKSENSKKKLDDLILEVLEKCSPNSHHSLKEQIEAIKNFIPKERVSLHGSMKKMLHKDTTIETLKEIKSLLKKISLLGDKHRRLSRGSRMSVIIKPGTLSASTSQLSSSIDSDRSSPSISESSTPSGSMIFMPKKVSLNLDLSELSDSSCATLRSAKPVRPFPRSLLESSGKLHDSDKKIRHRSFTELPTLSPATPPEAQRTTEPSLQRGSSLREVKSVLTPKSQDKNAALSFFAKKISSVKDVFQLAPKNTDNTKPA